MSETALPGAATLATIRYHPLKLYAPAPINIDISVDNMVTRCVSVDIPLRYLIAPNITDLLQLVAISGSNTAYNINVRRCGDERPSRNDTMS